MRYRILTNGEEYKVQIKRFLFWFTLQINANEIIVPIIMRDVVYDTYKDATTAALKYIIRVTKETSWKVAPER